MTSPREAVRYAFGGVNGRAQHFTILGRVVDLERSLTRGRWQFSSSVKEALEPWQSGVDSVTRVTGTYKLGYAKTKPFTILHFRVQCHRSGSAAHVSETAVLLDKNGPEFKLSAAVPTSPEMPEGVAFVFQGCGWVIEPGMFPNEVLSLALEREIGDYAYPENGCEVEGEFDLFELEPLSPARGGIPNIMTGQAADPEPDRKRSARIMPSTYRRRRVKIRR